MPYKTMSFSRSSSGYNAENGDYLDFDPDSSLSFGSLYKCTDFYAEITGGITSATTSGRTHEMNLQLKIGSTWRTIWSGEMYLPARGTTGYEITFSGTIPSSYQAEAAANGITDIRLQQSGDYALRGANASGSIQITYEYNVTNCGAPSNPALSASETLDRATLSWTAGSGGTNNAVTGYVITYQESSDGSTWGEVNYYGETSGTSITVNASSTVGYYRRFGIQTKGTAGDDYLSSVVWSGSLKRINTTACGAPTACSLSENSSAGKEVTLSWSGATAGTDNAITGYEVQRCESSDGITWGSWETISNPTASPLSVSPPSTYGHYYKYRVRTKGAAGSAYYSGWKESGTLMRGRPALLSYTDHDLVAGVTKVKAVHMAELQENVNRMRESLGLSSYTFTTIQAGYTSLAGWSAHVAELRTAIDEMSATHETWIAISVNCPTVAVMEQLRRVVAAI